MAGKAQMRPAIADAGEEIVDAFIALAKGKARTGEAERRQLGLEKVERAAFMRRFSLKGTTAASGAAA